MIPENKIESVNKALNSLFGTTNIDNINKITIGLSGALVFKIEVHGKFYLLRIITRTDSIVNPEKHYEYMKLASDIGISPKVFYLDIENRFSIIEYIEPKLFPISEARNQIPDLLKKLHTLPKFHKVMDAFQMADMYIQKFQSLKIISETELGEIFKKYNEISKLYPRNEGNLVSCHNDLKPENIIYDGQRPWLIDWEASFLNEKYFDLSIVSNFVNTNIEEEINFLKKYLEKDPSEYDLACFYLMQQVCHLNYFLVFMVILASQNKSIDLNNTSKYNYREFHNKMWNGEITLEGDESRLHYALIHKEKLENNLNSSRFKESIEIIS